MDSPLDLDAYNGDVHKLRDDLDSFLATHAHYARARTVWNSLGDADRIELAESVALWLLT